MSQVFSGAGFFVMAHPSRNMSLILPRWDILNHLLPKTPAISARRGKSKGGNRKENIFQERQ